MLTWMKKTAESLMAFKEFMQTSKIALPEEQKKHLGFIEMIVNVGPDSDTEKLDNAVHAVMAEGCSYLSRSDRSNFCKHKHCLYLLQ